MTSSTMRSTMRILYFQLSQMIYWNVLSGFVIHRKDVSGRLNEGKARESERHMRDRC